MQANDNDNVVNIDDNDWVLYVNYIDPRISRIVIILIFNSNSSFFVSI